MKAHFILILLSIIALPTIYFIFDYNYPWMYFIPLGYLAYSFVVGVVSWIRSVQWKK